MPTLPHEVIVADVVYPAILLVYGWSLGLLPAMVGSLQSGFQALCRSFCNMVADEDREGNVVVSPDGEPQMKTPNPRVEFPYAYLMAWYIMHCSSLISAVQSSEDSIPFVQWLERSTWNGWYMLMIRQILQSSMNYQFVRCFSNFPGASYGERFFDRRGADGFTILSSGFFWWLINIRPGYLVFCQRNVCTIEPYLTDLLANSGMTNYT